MVEMEDQEKNGLKILKGSEKEFLTAKRSHKGQKLEDYDLSLKYTQITVFDALEGGI